MRRIASFIDGSSILGLAGLVGALSIFFFAQAADSVDRMAFAKRIEMSSRINPARLASQAESVLRLVHSGPICGAIDRKANIVISFREFAERNQASGYEEWAKAAEGVDRLLRHAIRCSPHDGEFWARLALVGREIVIAPERLDAMLRMSQTLSPAELPVIRMRSLLWGSGVGADDEPTRQAALADLRTMLDEAQEWDAARMVASFRPAMQADIQRLAANLPSKRQEILNRHAVVAPREETKVENSKKLLFLDAN